MFENKRVKELEKENKELRVLLTDLDTKFKVVQGKTPPSSIPPLQKGKSLFPQMHQMQDLETGLYEHKNISKRLTRELDALTEDSNMMLTNLKEYLLNAQNLKAKIEELAEGIETTWIRVNFLCEYLQNIDSYSMKNKDRMKTLSDEIEQDRMETKVPPTPIPPKFKDSKQ